MEKLIITCAPTGSLTIPAQTQYLPLTPKQIADEAVRAAEAGCTMVHIHARDPKDGKPTSSPEIFREIIADIKARSNVVVGITTGGGGGMTAEERVKVVPILKPELASLNMGPVCLNLKGITKRIKDEEYVYPWEKDYLNSISGVIQHNTYDSIEVFLKAMNDSNTRYECECYDVSHVYNVAYFKKEGLLKSPVMLQFVTGGVGMIGSLPEEILFMKNTADRLLGKGEYHWSVIGAGLNYTSTVPQSIIMGGHVRVGMEDNIFIQKGVLAKSNAEFVEKAVSMARDIGREIATPDEARAMLSLKGKNNVNY